MYYNETVFNSRYKQYGKEFDSLDYLYLKRLIEGYRSTKKGTKKRIYVSEWGWSYFSDKAQLLLTLVKEELQLFPYRSWSIEPLMRWLPNGELHVENYSRLCRIRGGGYQEIWV